MITARAVTDPLFTLAEGPVWDARANRLMWVDIIEGLVLVGRLDDGVVSIVEEHRFDGFVGSVAPAVDGAMLVAETRGLTRVDSDGARESIVDLDPVGPEERLNDGTCDARGRFLVGTLSLAGRHESQRLFQVADGSSLVLDEDLGLSNGLGFSPDGAVLYSVDSVPGRVWQRPYDQASGVVGPRSLLLDLPGATPDGLAVDSRGDLWVAMWGLGEVRCYTTAGEHRETVQVPAPHTTSVAFIGARLDRMIITTARSELTDDQLEAFPLSGSLFIATPPCPGVPTYPWSDDVSTAPTRLHRSDP